MKNKKQKQQNKVINDNQNYQEEFSNDFSPQSANRDAFLEDTNENNAARQRSSQEFSPQSANRDTFTEDSNN